LLIDIIGVNKINLNIGLSARFLAANEICSLENSRKTSMLISSKRNKVKNHY